MLASPCDTCAFFNKDKSTCEQSQFYISTKKCNYSPGFCRLWRSKKWYDANKDLSPPQLKEKARKESELKYDLLIIHNNDNNLETLKENIFINSTNNICKRIIIADTTRQGDRKKIIGLFKKHEGPKFLDILVVDHEEEKPGQTIKRVARMIKEKYFIVIPSSKVLSGQDNKTMINEINNRDTRFIYYPFMNKLAQTIILPLQPIFGLYLKPSYSQLTQLTEIPKTFYERLKEEELSTGISLSCPIDITI